MKLNIPPEIIFEEMTKESNEKSNIESNFFESSEDIPDPKELKPTEKNLMILDDILLQNKTSAKCIILAVDIAPLIAFT